MNLITNLTAPTSVTTAISSCITICQFEKNDLNRHLDIDLGILNEIHFKRALFDWFTHSFYINTNAKWMWGMSDHIWSTTPAEITFNWNQTNQQIQKCQRQREKKNHCPNTVQTAFSPITLSFALTTFQLLHESLNLRGIIDGVMLGGLIIRANCVSHGSTRLFLLFKKFNQKSKSWIDKLTQYNN